MARYADQWVSKMVKRVTKEQVVGEFRCRGISEAAMRVVGRKGLERATVQEIADEAGVAKGTVYLYFRSRDEILEKTTQAAVAELLDRIRAAAEAGGPFREALERVLTAQLGYFDERQDFFRLYFSMGDGTAERIRQRQENRRRYTGILVAMLDAAAATGAVRVDDPERTAVAIAGAAREVILRRIDEKPPRPLAQDVQLLVDLVSRGIGVSRRTRRG